MLVAIAISATGHARAAEAPDLPVSDAATRAYVDLELTRLAIFAGRIAEARRLIHEAADAFEGAKDDPSVVTKSESELRTPHPAAAHPAAAPASTGGRSPAEAEAETAAMNRAKQENSAHVWAGGAPNDAAAAAFNSAAEERAATAANAAKQEAAAKAYSGGAPRRWLPVDAEIGLPRDFDAGAERAAAVAAANAKLAAGDRAGALTALTSAGIRLQTVVGVLPLDPTLADVHQAAALVDAGKYYEASQLIRRLQDRQRYDASRTTFGGAQP